MLAEQIKYILLFNSSVCISKKLLITTGCKIILFLFFLSFSPASVLTSMQELRQKEKQSFLLCFKFLNTQPFSILCVHLFIPQFFSVRFQVLNNPHSKRGLQRRAFKVLESALAFSYQVPCVWAEAPESESSGGSWQQSCAYKLTSLAAAFKEQRHGNPNSHWQKGTPQCMCSHVTKQMIRWGHVFRVKIYGKKWSKRKYIGVWERGTKTGGNTFKRSAIQSVKHNTH